VEEEEEEEAAAMSVTKRKAVMVRRRRRRRWWRFPPTSTKWWVSWGAQTLALPLIVLSHGRVVGVLEVAVVATMARSSQRGISRMKRTKNGKKKKKCLGRNICCR
jgi:hypothetical protein